MSLDAFMVDSTPHLPIGWGSEVEKERHLRIKLSIAAYAYEVYSDSIISDHQFDDMALRVNQQLTTGNELLDKFFVEEFSPYTGQWIHKHPDKEGLEKIYQKHYNKNKMSVK
jgi:hypothetical protein